MWWEVYSINNTDRHKPGILGAHVLRQTPGRIKQWGPVSAIGITEILVGIWKVLLRMNLSVNTISHGFLVLSDWAGSFYQVMLSLFIWPVDAVVHVQSSLSMLFFKAMLRHAKIRSTSYAVFMLIVSANTSARRTYARIKISCLFATYTRRFPVSLHGTQA